MKLVFFLALLGGCKEQATVDLTKLAFLQVELLEDYGSTQDNPIDFTSEGTDFNLRVTALNRDADPLSITTPLSIKSRPGKLVEEDQIEMVDGVWEGNLQVVYGFGPTTVWFSDDKGTDSRDPSFVTGISSPVYFQFPTVKQLQQTDDHETNPLVGEFGEIRTKDREVVVTAVGAAGIWVTDLMDDPGDYNGLFIYTFSKPTYSTSTGELDLEDLEAQGIYRDVVPGDRLEILTGCNQEYIATTQFSFPNYKFVDDGGHTLPDPVQFDGLTACDNDLMEKLESSVVRVENVTIDNFEEGEESDWGKYGQWPITLDGCSGSVVVQSEVTIPGFYPTEHKGEQLDYVQGTLSEAFGTWIISPRDENDISADVEPTKRSSQPARRVTIIKRPN